MWRSCGRARENTVGDGGLTTERTEDTEKNGRGNEDEKEKSLGSILRFLINGKGQR